MNKKFLMVVSGITLLGLLVWLLSYLFGEGND